MKKHSNKSILRRLSAFREFIWHLVGLIITEVKSQDKIPFLTTLWLWKNGFLRKSLLIYDLNKSTVKDYVSDYRQFVKTPLINGEYTFILDNKLTFAKVLQKYKKFLPETYCLLKNNQVLPVNDDRSLYNLDDIITLCYETKHLVIKPAFGRNGWDVYLLQVIDGKLVLNNSEVNHAEVRQFLSGLDDYLVCEYITQHKYAFTIFCGSVNTIRMLSMWDYEENVPFIAAAVHRFGRTFTVPIDNWSQGGLFCKIDLEIGMLGKSASFLPERQLRFHEKHPDTNVQIEGVNIPRWEATTTKILKITNHIPFIPNIGWDVIITEEGFKILEGNSARGLSLQMYFPLLKDQRVRKFYKRFNVI